MQKINLEQEAMELQRKQDVLQALESGEWRERKRLSEELHDGVGAALSAIKYGLEHIETRIFTDTEARDGLRRNILYLNAVINDTRRISRNLQPEFINQKGLTTALEELAIQLNERGETHFQIYVEAGFPQELADSTSLTIYRIIAELFNNVLKHAGAKGATAQLTEADGQILLIVEDDGNGMDATDYSTNGIGLLNLKNRVLESGGTMNIDSSGHGVTTIITLPINVS